MNKILTAIFLLCITACGAPNQMDRGDHLQDSDVTNTTDETVEGDFVFRLVSEKGAYEVGEEINLYGELEYIGDKEEITIHHSSSAILFPMREQTRGYEIDYPVNDIGLTTTLKKGSVTPYREKYAKSGGFSADQDPMDYVMFMEDFLNTDDFPPGNYIVHGVTQFSSDSGEDRDQQRFAIKATVNFKVID
ncbi:hypothetical protein BEP19_01995 [Ammoniphilus oxalaticus]|uniref:Uncharacterized protein n=1 Tax=Ammoniphilus oxalaticus TaxID=66863 RepID=A0A419SN84_9BACL|nr:hypothetical protein [Ammoniphilus oxalaticus]RKD25737.1 hypothetical protein BEP19_01995 [Ammoniphilus oxalaticus]